MRDIKEIKGEVCPICHKKTLILREQDIEVPFFGKLCVFSMTCTSCKYHQADVESEEKKEPVRYTIEINTPEDLKIRVIKSSKAKIKIPHVIEVKPGPVSQGYITNIEGILKRIKHSIEIARDAEEDKETKKKAWKLIKKINRVLWGQGKLKLIIEDPTGNSAIISDKAEKKKL